MRTLAEVAIKWPDDAAVTGKTFRDMLVIGRRMETMVADLLLVAQSEEGKLPLHIETLVIAEVVAETWAPLAAPAQRKQLQITMDVAREVFLHTDPALLRHILTNLFNNAVDYTPAGGCIRVQALMVGTEFILSVENTTDNLTPDDLPHLFERFWRKDPARTGAGHGGVGLTLSQSVAANLGLTLGAEMAGPDKLRVVLRGPSLRQRASGVTPPRRETDSCPA